MKAIETDDVLPLCDAACSSDCGSVHVSGDALLGWCYQTKGDKVSVIKLYQPPS